LIASPEGGAALALPAAVALATGPDETAADDTGADGLAPVDGPQAATAKATATPAINALDDLHRKTVALRLRIRVSIRLLLLVSE
jgi:hypothetical protein